MTCLQDVIGERRRRYFRTAALTGFLAIQVKESRDTLGEADTAVAAAHGELAAFADRYEKLVDEWTCNGCKGPRLNATFGEHAALESKLHQALHGAGSNKTALNTLAAREEQTRRQLAEIEWRIKAINKHSPPLLAGPRRMPNVFILYRKTVYCQPGIYLHCILLCTTGKYTNIKPRTYFSAGSRIIVDHVGVVLF